MSVKHKEITKGNLKCRLVGTWAFCIDLLNYLASYLILFTENELYIKDTANFAAYSQNPIVDKNITLI